MIYALRLYYFVILFDSRVYNEDGEVVCLLGITILQFLFAASSIKDLIYLRCLAQNSSILL
jgi:hypothetical protein